MKKILILLLALSLILSLFSCTISSESISTSEESTGDIENIVYTDSSETGYLMIMIDSIMYKLYPEEGIVVPLCPDPLCKHKSESCVFYDTNKAIKNVDNVLYYVKEKDSQGNFKSICSYDLDKNEYRVLYESATGKAISSLFDVSGDYLFFDLTEFLVAEKTQTHFLTRIDLKTGEVKQLSKKSELGTISLMTVENDRYYWFDYGTGEYFTTDVNFENRTDNQMGFTARNVTGNKCFLTEIKKETFGGMAAIDVYEVKKENGEKVKVLENIGMIPAFYNGKIIYAIAGEEVIIGSEERNERNYNVVDKFGGKYYICDSDGSNQKLLCDISGNKCVIQPSSAVSGDVTGVGDYVVLKVVAYETTEESKDTEKECIEKSGDKYVIINIVTGDYR